MDFGLHGRRVVVTGASRGLGRAIAESFAQAGAALGLLARNEAALKELAGQLPAEVIAVACDVSEEHDVELAFAEIADRLGGVDSVVANAGISPETHRAQNLSAQTWQAVLNTNLTGTFLTARAAHRYLAASDRGRLVLTSSAMARIPRRGLSAYAASKAGIDGLTRALAVDWAPDHICVNAIAPGFVDAGLGTAFANSRRLRDQVLSRTPLARFGTTPEITTTAAYLAGDHSAYLTGQILAIDGGYGLG